MKRLLWLYYLVRPSRVDFARLAHNARVRESLSRLDGSPRAAVSLLTGLSAAELDGLGGFESPASHKGGVLR